MIETGRLIRDAARADADRASLAAGRRVAEGADGAGLLDVGYARLDSPIGSILVAATPRGVVRLGYLYGQSEEAVVRDLAESVSPRVLEAPGRVDDARRELDEYFEGRRRRFELKLDWRLTRGFHRRVLRATADLDYGETASYAQVAGLAGSPRAYRAAGNALHSNPLPIVVPCHRVLHSGGGLGGYGGGLDAKRYLLQLERAL
jgi:methylated-DNA-[protein]-cysteine S-methyltransferase